MTMSLSCEVRLGPRAARNDFGQGIVDAGSGSDSGVLRKYYTMCVCHIPAMMLRDDLTINGYQYANEVRLRR